MEDHREDVVVIFAGYPEPMKEFLERNPGGSVTAGMAIYDTMNYVKCDVSTICIGMAASMGAIIGSMLAKRLTTDSLTRLL